MTTLAGGLAGTAIAVVIATAFPGIGVVSGALLGFGCAMLGCLLGMAADR